MNIPLNQIPNPTDDQRHEMTKNSLETEGRLEDYEYILNLLSPPSDITNYALPSELRGIKIGVIGGGVYTYYFDQEGKYYNELGAPRIPATHETTWHYINTFNLSTRSQSTIKRNNFIYVHNTRLRTSDSIQEIPSKLSTLAFIDLYTGDNLPPLLKDVSGSDVHSFAFFTSNCHWATSILICNHTLESFSLLPTSSCISFKALQNQLLLHHNKVHFLKKYPSS